MCTVQFQSKSVIQHNSHHVYLLIDAMDIIHSSINTDVDSINNITMGEISSDCNTPPTLDIDGVNEMDLANFDICNNQIIDNKALMFSENLLHEIKLLKIINQLGMPLYSYKILIDWAQDICASSNKFQPEHYSYENAVKHFEKMFHLQNYRPKKIPVTLYKDNVELPVITFSVSAMLESLFNDTNLNCTENLVVNSVN